MTPAIATITITLPLHPTDGDLRTAREVLALLRSTSVNTDKNRGDNEDDDTTETPTPENAFNPTPPGGAGSTTFQVDSSGLPWDARIHSGSKDKNKDGRWKKRKGVQDSEVTKIEGEIRAALAAGKVTPPSTPPPPPAAETQVTPPPPPTAEVVAPPTTVAPPPPIAPPVAGGTTFAQLMAKVSANIATGKLTQAEALAAAQSAGLTSLVDLPKRADLVPAVEAYIDAVVMSKG